MDPTNSLLALLPKLRGLPDEYPAFFYLDGVKVEVKIRVQRKVQIDPSDCEIADFTDK